MTPLILDTSYLIDYFNGKYFSNDDSVENAIKEKRVYYNRIILTELISGVRHKKDKSRMELVLSGLTYLPLKYSDFSRGGEIRNELFKQGFLMSTPDSLIATHAKEYNLELITMDSFFLKAGDLIEIKVEIPTVL